MALDPFTVATDSLSEAGGSVSELARPFLRFLPVSGASVSTFGTLLGAETVSATDALAGRVDELQFDLGEGPCWDALASRRPVLITDLRQERARWPLFSAGLGDTPAGALFAFPLALGSLNIGAVDLYRRLPGTLTADEVADATALAGICARQVFRRSLADVPVPGVDRDSGEGFSRREVHQATGMVLAQLGVSAADALLIINGYAFARGRTVREVAADIVARRIDLSSDWTDPLDTRPESL